jgi:hypothetical protein
MKKPAVTPGKKIPVDKSLLNEDEMLELKKQARASVLAEMEQDARDAYFQEQVALARQANTPNERLVSVTMELAPFLPNIMIDGVMYFHEYTYDVPFSRAKVLYEQMQRSWQHQDEIDGRSRFNAYRRPANVRLGPQHASVPTRGANGTITAETEI